MLDLFLSESAGWFAVPAILGTFFFTLRLVLMLIGGAGDSGDFGDADIDFDVDVDADFDTGDAPVDHSDPSQAFKVLSIQAIAGFLMGFGWAGLGAYRSADMGVPTSVVIGLVGGGFMVWLLGLMMKIMRDFESSGNISIRTTIGRSGVVYITVPAKGSGRGQVKVTLDNNRQRIFNAVTEGEELTTTTAVTITKANDNNTITVTKV